jgi:hypothetical protein
VPALSPILPADGKTDPAYYDNVARGFYIWRSRTGTSTLVPTAVFDAANDIPVFRPHRW